MTPAARDENPGEALEELIEILKKKGILSDIDVRQIRERLIQ